MDSNLSRGCVMTQNIYSDAGFAELNNGRLQPEYIVFNVSDNDSHVPISWQCSYLFAISENQESYEKYAGSSDIGYG